MSSNGKSYVILRDKYGNLDCIRVRNKNLEHYKRHVENGDGEIFNVLDPEADMDQFLIRNVLMIAAIAADRRDLKLREWVVMAEDLAERIQRIKSEEDPAVRKRQTVEASPPPPENLIEAEAGIRKTEQEQANG